ncbi:MAG: hypothetical protein ABI769_13070 [Pseudomonadota bacterium]
MSHAHRGETERFNVAGSCTEEFDRRRDCGGREASRQAASGRLNAIWATRAFLRLWLVGDGVGARYSAALRQHGDGVHDRRRQQKLRGNKRVDERATILAKHWAKHSRYDGRSPDLFHIRALAHFLGVERRRKHTT